MSVCKEHGPTLGYCTEPHYPDVERALEASGHKPGPTSECPRCKEDDDRLATQLENDERDDGLVLIPADALARLREGLEEIREFADQRVDADCVGDPPRMVGNAWCEVLRLCDEALRK